MQVLVEEEEEEEEVLKEESTEATGLTPDWIIHAAAYDVFQLEVRSPSSISRSLLGTHS